MMTERETTGVYENIDFIPSKIIECIHLCIKLATVLSSVNNYLSILITKIMINWTMLIKSDIVYSERSLSGIAPSKSRRESFGI